MMENVSAGTGMEQESANSAGYVKLLFIGMVLYTVRGSFVVFQEVLEKATHANMWYSQGINMSFHDCAATYLFRGSLQSWCLSRQE